jgi:capsular polysaccharide biosynthesis protein
MAKRRGEQKQIVKKKAAHREAAITPAKWFNIIVTALLIGVVLIVAYGYLKQWM